MSEQTLGRNFSGWAPGSLGLAVAPDGRTAYVSFALDDSLLVVDLWTFTVIDSIDVSPAGSMLFSSTAALSPDGRKLYVSNGATKNVMVIDTVNRRVEKVLPLQPLSTVTITMSQDGSKAYIPSEDGGLYIINTSDDSYRRILIGGVLFGPIVPSPSNPDLLYTIGGLIDSQGTYRSSFFCFNIFSNAVVRSSRLADEVLPPPTFPNRFIIDSDETTACFGWMQMAGQQGGDRGIGNFIVFNMNTFQVSASLPMENGVTDFAVNWKTGKAYIIGFWAGGSSPNELPILEYDMVTNSVIRSMLMSPSSDQRAIVIDPTNDNCLYMTEGDANLLRKVDISSGRETRRLQFNKAEIQPYAIIRGDGDTGYVVCRSSPEVYRLDLKSGRLMGSILLPFSYHAWGFHRGKLYLGSGSDIYAVNPSDGSIIERYRVGNDFQPTTFTFFDSKMVTIDYETMMIGRRLLFFDAETMTTLKSIELPREPHGDKVLVSPDESKLYVISGPMMGTATIKVLDASTLKITNTIKIPPGPMPSHGATGFIEGDFDETKRILYLTGFASIYKINMDTDKLIGTLDLRDAYGAQNIQGWSPTGLCGVALSPGKDRLFIVSGDAHSVYTYDLTKSSWTTRIINLHGYFVTDAVCSPDGRYLYTVNCQSDSITMVDLASGDIAGIIRLEQLWKWF